MNGVEGTEGFAAFVRDEIGLAVTAEDLGRSLDELPGWDSMHLLWLITALERHSGRSLSFPRVLEASTLAEIYDLAVTA